MRWYAGGHKIAEAPGARKPAKPFLWRLAIYVGFEDVGAKDLLKPWPRR